MWVVVSGIGISWRRSFPAVNTKLDVAKPICNINGGENRIEKRPKKTSGFESARVRGPRRGTVHHADETRKSSCVQSTLSGVAGSVNCAEDSLRLS